MWPFRSKTVKRPAVLHNGITAEYSSALNMWSFYYEGIEFTFDGHVLDVRLFECPREIMAVVEGNKQEVRKIVTKNLKGWCDDREDEEFEGIDITDYLDKKRFNVSLAGGEMWGDLIVNIVFANGEIDHDYSSD